MKVHDLVSFLNRLPSDYWDAELLIENKSEKEHVCGYWVFPEENLVYLICKSK